MNAYGYDPRPPGDSKTKQKSMAELKLRRLTELNNRLREDLDRRRIPVSDAAQESVFWLLRLKGDELTDVVVLSHSRTENHAISWSPLDGARCVKSLPLNDIRACC